MIKHVSAKQKMINYLSKSKGYNTFSVAQGRKLFGVQNVAARIDELRKLGISIVTRLKKDDRSRYFGPFAHSGLLRRTLAQMRRHGMSCACGMNRQPGNIATMRLTILRPWRQRLLMVGR